MASGILELLKRLIAKRFAFALQGRDVALPASILRLSPDLPGSSLEDELLFALGNPSIGSAAGMDHGHRICLTQARSALAGLPLSQQPALPKPGYFCQAEPTRNLRVRP
jgi:hypothetical protein